MRLLRHERLSEFMSEGRICIVGVLKNLMIEWDERGYGPIEGSVCADHVHDGFLAERITATGTERCTYCGGPGAAALEDVLVDVKRAVDEYYVPAISHLGWDVFPRAADSEDVLLHIVGDDFDEDVFNDIVEAFSHNDERWTPLADDGALGDSWLGAGWARFRRWVVTRSRFLLEPPSEEDHEFGQAPQEMLREIGGLILSEGLVKPLPSGTPVYRARVFPNDVEGVSARDMSAPPARLASAGRMNPRGIPMFYGALDAETAAVEAYDGSHQAVIAEFRTLVGLEVVDLTSLPTLPSIYDNEQSGRRRKLLFLADFARDIAKPIDRDEQREIKYLPSQAVIEYMRLALGRTVGTSIHGVLFRSSRNGNAPAVGYPDSKPAAGVNVTLFCGPEAALTDEQIFTESESASRIRSEKQLLEINPDNIRLYRFGPPAGEFRHNIELRARTLRGRASSYTPLHP